MKSYFRANTKYSVKTRPALIKQVPKKSHLSEYYQLAPMSEFNREVFRDKDPLRQEVCDFVLALAVFHNDFKDSIFAYFQHSNSQSKITKGINPDYAQWGGIRIHIVRILFGQLWEFLELIKSNKRSVSHSLFLDVLKKLPPNVRDSWNKVQDIALSNTAKDPIWKKIMLFRQNVAFHYSATSFGEGYKTHFFHSGSKSEIPYCSLGTSMEENRFFFADAAAQTYLTSKTGDPDVLWRQIDQLHADLNKAIGNIVPEFIITRGGAFSQP